MTGKAIGGRRIYMRVTEDGKRKYVAIGKIMPDGTTFVDKGMPLSGWWGGYW